jgi:uncharacterized membrane protein
MPNARNFFTPLEQETIRMAIMNAELDTSGEIRVHIESNCSGDVMQKAWEVFEKLEMHKTDRRNGVLIYLAVKNRKFAIIGDQGIHAKVSEGYWDSIKGNMLDKFRDNQFTDGLVEAITETGKQLKTYFPYQTDDKNELPDDISFN